MGVRTNAQGISIAPLKTALQYADSKLGITVATSSYSDICTALSNYFPSFDGVFFDVNTHNTFELLDDTGYLRTPSFTTADVPQFTSSGLRTGIINADNVHCRAILSAEKVDVTNYNALYFTLGGTTYSLDISSVSGSYYVYIGSYFVAGVAYYMEWGLTSTKNYYATNSVKSQNMGTASSGNPYNSLITKIWCE